jgi:selenoprotein W-related protein
LEAELRHALGPQTEIELIPGSGGVFRVCADSRQIFSKKETRRFPERGEIAALLLQQST